MPYLRLCRYGLHRLFWEGGEMMAFMKTGTPEKGAKVELPEDEIDINAVESEDAEGEDEDAVKQERPMQ